MATITKVNVHKKDNGEYYITFFTNEVNFEIDGIASFQTAGNFEKNDKSAAIEMARSMLGQRVDQALCWSDTTAQYDKIVFSKNLREQQ